MLAYGGALLEQGWLTIVMRALRRGWEIYVAFLLLLIAYFVLIWAIGNGTRYLDETNTRFFFENPGTALAHAAILQYTPVNTDILPTFVLLHLAFPVVLWLLIRSAKLALAISLMLYLTVQMFSWYVPAWPTGELYFNPLAWQILFVFGAWYADEGARRLKTIVQSRASLVLALLYLALSLPIALSWEIKPLEEFIPDAISKLIYPIYKSHLAPLRLLHFFTLAILISRLTQPNWNALMKPRMMALIRCGENSLAIFCLGVLLSFTGLVILTEFSSTIAMQIVISIAGIALMVAAATLMTWTSKQDRPGPRLF
jgi:hypothetical protein